MEQKLKRSISLPSLILYGLGTMVGGGFYALLGTVLGEAGLLAPIALLIAGIIALINSFTFSELSARFPVSAGESRYVLEGFKETYLSQLTGWMVIATGVISAATLAVATARFTVDLIPANLSLATVFVALSMGALAIWGVAESVFAVVTITILEVGTLLLIVFLHGGSLTAIPSLYAASHSESTFAALPTLFSAAFLAFYSFIGFEDMVNMAEEVENPERNLPIALPITVLLTTMLYILVTLVAISSGLTDRMAQSNTPIAVLLGDYGAIGIIGVGIVSILTGFNGALVQIIMASRVGYGLASQGQAPQWLGVINEKTKTPINATILITTVIMLAALFFPLRTLAEITSTVLLAVFTLVNIALVKIKLRDEQNPETPHFPIAVPILGALLCGGFVVGKICQAIG